MNRALAGVVSFLVVMSMVLVGVGPLPEAVGIAAATVECDWESGDCSSFESSGAKTRTDATSGQGSWSLKVSDDGGGTKFPTSTGSPSNATQLVKFPSFDYGGSGYSSVLRLQDDSTGDDGVAIQVDGDGNIIAWEGSTTRTNTGITISADQWYEVRATNINMSGDVYDIEVYDLNGDLVGNYTGASFLETTSTFSENQVSVHPDQSHIFFDYFATNEPQGTFTPRPNEVSGHVVDENGNPVSNATVRVYGFDYNNYTGTRQEIQRKIDNTRAKLKDPEPDSWENQDGLDHDLTGTGGHLDQIDQPVVLAHTASQWQLGGYEPIASGKGPNPTYRVNTDPSLGEPKVQVPADEELILSVWTPHRPLVTDSADEDIPGFTSDEGTVVIEQLGAADSTLSRTTATTSPRIDLRTGLVNKQHEAVQVSLDPGFYRVYPEGHPEASYVIVVGNPDRITSQWIESLKDKENALTDRAQALEDKIANGKIDSAVVTKTNETGHWNASISSSTVNEATVVAYRKPDSMTAADWSGERPTRQEIRAYTNDQLKRARQQVASNEDDTLAIDCSEDAATTGAIYAPVEAKDTAVPNSNVTVRVREMPGEFLDIRNQLCQREALFDKLRAAGLPGLVNYFSQQLVNGLTLEQAQAWMESYVKQVAKNPEVCKQALIQQGVTDFSDCNVDGPDGPDPGGDGVYGPPGSGIPATSDAINATKLNDLEAQLANVSTALANLQDTIDSGDVSSDVGNDTVSLRFPFDTDLADASVTVRVLYSNGSARVLDTSSEYVHIDDTFGGGDAVVVEEYPLREGDAAVADFRVDVATSDGLGSSRRVVRNPNFAGRFPDLDSISLSKTQPGPDDRVTVRLNPATSGNVDSLENVTVYQPDDTSYQAELKGSRKAAFTTNGSGTYHLALNYTTSDGTVFTETVSLEAGEAGTPRPPTLRVQRGLDKDGHYAIASDGFTDGRISIEDGGQRVVAAGVIDATSDAPNRMHVHLQGLGGTAARQYDIRVLRGSDEATVRSHITTTVHVGKLPEDALIYRGTDTGVFGSQPIQYGERAQWGVAHRTGNGTTIRTRTTSAGQTTITVISDPGRIQRAQYFVATKIRPLAPISLTAGVPGWPAAAGGLTVLLAAGLLAGKRRRRAS